MIRNIEIETAIRSVSWYTQQVGQKSLQRVSVDFDTKTILGQYLTGTTKMLCLELGSVRDSFVVERPRFSSDGRAFFTVTGQTATGVHVMPNINYSFDIEISESEIEFSGAHDGYPSYNISVDGVQCVRLCAGMDLAACRHFGRQGKFNESFNLTTLVQKSG